MTNPTHAKRASHVTLRAQQTAREALPYDDRQDFADAERGFVGSLENAEYLNGSGRTAWSMAPYAFLQEDEAAPSVNPSLWRQAQLNCAHGLFKVLDRVYQVRGLDLANMTLIEGESGVIVVDTLSTREGAEAALALYRKHRGDRPVSAVIVTHTHVDHWGGLLGIAAREEYVSGRMPFLAPDEFLEHAVSENVVAGPVMRRRAGYQFGNRLPPGPLGHVDNGLGKGYPLGRPGLVAPNDLIRATGETRMIDGLEFVFQMAPDTEAPAEMHMFLPQLGLLNMAENAVHNFHNLLPFRGAQVRNSLDWSRYIDEARDLWGKDAQALIGQHHWPVWDSERICDYLAIQRDLYKYTHDQTLRLANQGLTPQEIAEALELPETIASAWHARGYYGSLRHNAKAIYQHYLGWYDGVPSRLDPLPPTENGKRMVAYMGGAEAVIARVGQDLASETATGEDYRFAAEVLTHVVFADPENAEARALLADVYEQLGYASECATWRNSYLTAAMELRDGAPKSRGRAAIMPDTLAALSSVQVFDMLATRLAPDRAEGLRIQFLVAFTDRGELLRVRLENSTLTVRALADAESDLPRLDIARAALDGVILGTEALTDLVTAGGEAGALLGRVFDLFDEPDTNFAIVEP